VDGENARMVVKMDGNDGNDGSSLGIPLMGLKEAVECPGSGGDKDSPVF